jgi:predicted outer membrane protein
MLYRVTFHAALIAAVSSMPLLSHAQVAQQQPGRAVPAQVNQANPGAPRTAMENHDAFFAEWLTTDNDNEIALAKLAAEKSSNDQVKQFAQRMMSEHQKLNEQLARFTTGTGRQNDTAQRAPNGQNAQPTEPQRRTVARVTEQGEIPGQPRAQGATMLSLKKELADQCLMSAREELDRKSGREFDECYMHMQIGAHMYVIDAMRVFERHASAELKQVIAAGERTAKDHLEMAKKIVAMENQSQSAGRQ